MARIKIVDLPTDIKISPEEMKKVMGGISVTDLSAQALEPDPWVLRTDSPLNAIDSRGRKIPVFHDSDSPLNAIDSRGRKIPVFHDSI